ncbi:uncharacterized protein LOC126157688 [Schistocerca cancellata]|uniref:uncharacterized protein LOC126157688 n=1 Tax=Schistocerca cancellata TaxID=274614 RepID=UPI0021190E40|nr:uncharacterized protein LOC126157688 [Schistocerca cancellata]
MCHILRDSKEKFILNYIEVSMHKTERIEQKEDKEQPPHSPTPISSPAVPRAQSGPSSLSTVRPSHPASLVPHLLLQNLLQQIPVSSGKQSPPTPPQVPSVSHAQPGPLSPSTVQPSQPATDLSELPSQIVPQHTPLPSGRPPPPTSPQPLPVSPAQPGPLSPSTVQPSHPVSPVPELPSQILPHQTPLLSGRRPPPPPPQSPPESPTQPGPSSLSTVRPSHPASLVPHLLLQKLLQQIPVSSGKQSPPPPPQVPSVSHAQSGPLSPSTVQPSQPVTAVRELPSQIVAQQTPLPSGRPPPPTPPLYLPVSPAQSGPLSALTVQPSQPTTPVPEFLPPQVLIKQSSLLPRGPSSQLSRPSARGIKKTSNKQKGWCNIFNSSSFNKEQLFRILEDISSGKLTTVN